MIKFKNNFSPMEILVNSIWLSFFMTIGFGSLSLTVRDPKIEYIYIFMLNFYCFFSHFKGVIKNKKKH